MGWEVGILTHSHRPMLVCGTWWGRAWPEDTCKAGRQACSTQVFVCMRGHTCIQSQTVLRARALGSWRATSKTQATPPFVCFFQEMSPPPFVP